MRTWMVLAGVFTLIACGDSSDRITAVDRQKTPETGAAAAVAKLDEAQRNGVLERAVRASGRLARRSPDRNARRFGPASGGGRPSAMTARPI